MEIRSADGRYYSAALALEMRLHCASYPNLFWVGEDQRVKHMTKLDWSEIRLC